MKCKIKFRALAGLAALIFTASAPADLPVIQSIQVEATNLVVTVRVPSGHVRVVLESRDRLRSGTWMPVGVQRGSGEGGTIAFRVPLASEFAYFRVRADETEPLPASFYMGTSSFDPEPFSFWPVPVYWPIYYDVTTFDALMLTTTSQSPDFTTMGLDGSGVPAEQREVVESDIWRLSGDTLYFFNQNRGLQVIDVANPDAPTIRGTLNLPAAGEQMYLLSSNHVVLLTRSPCGGEVSEVLIAALSNSVPRIVASLPVTGTITESRLVGTALYVAVQTTRPMPDGDVWERGTEIISFDLAVPEAPVVRSTLWYSGANNAVHATDIYFFAAAPHPANAQRSAVNVIDITAPDGTMNAGETINVAGRVADKFKLNWSENVLSVISEVAGSPWMTKLETFRLSDPRSLPPPATVKLGEVEVGHRERLFATRFDGARAYIVTFLQIDPLWIVDLSDPMHPTVSGELEVPGWSTYIHPLGDRLVAVGIDGNRTTVSLFEVSDPGAPALLSRVSLGDSYSYSEANNDEKAFTVLEDAGLILLPVQSSGGTGNRSWVQLIDLGTNSLTVRGVIEHDFVPRRATLHRNRIVSFSAVELLSVDATDRDAPQLSGRLELAWPVHRVFLAGNYLIEISNGNQFDTQVTPVVRVTPALDPGRVLTTLAFSNAPVVGATVRSNRLYVVQTLNSYWQPYVDDSDTNPPANLWLSIVDLSDLPTLSVLGKTATTNSPFFGWSSELESVWPRPDLLVWAVNNNHSEWGWGGSLDGILSGSLVSPVWSRSFQPRGSSGRLLAFDVSDNTAPTLLSDLNLAANGGWNFSKTFATDGLVYLSHQAFAELESTNAVSETNIVILHPWPRFQRSFLDVVDYADARQPAVRPPVNIPGMLQGISHQGELLYTVGFHRTSTNENDRAEALAVSAYDGVAAYLVDSLSLSNLSPHPILVSGTNIFLGNTQAFASSNLVSPTLETWTVSGTGDLTKLGSVTLVGSASDLISFPGLIAARLDANRVAVFDDSIPATLRQVGEGPSTGCILFNLRRGDAVATRELWLPLDAYGVIAIQLSP
jgi:hypothetical protein